MSELRRAVSSIPVIGGLIRSAYHSIRPPEAFPGSSKYWEQRYRKGGHSGNGSYRRLAEFKAEVLNAFVAAHSVQTVLELGCGDGAQLELASYANYVGVDVSRAAVDLCRRRFGSDGTKQFYALSELPVSLSAELTLSLDVIYHLVEDDVFEAHMRDLFSHSSGYVIIFAPNDEVDDPGAHVRRRKFTEWIATNNPGAELLEHIPNKYPYSPRQPDTTSFADFYIFRK